MPSKESQPPIQIGINPWAGYAFALLADDLGYLDVNGEKKIVFINYASLTDSKLAYINGNIDGLFSTMLEVVEIAQISNIIPSIVMVTNFSNGSDKILAKKGIENITDIKGKTIAVEMGSIGEYVLNRALSINGIPFSDVTLLDVKAKNIPSLFMKDMIDVAVTYPPYSYLIVQHAPNEIFHSGLIHNEIVDLLSINNEIIKDRPDDIKILIKGWLRAYDYYLKNPVKAHALITMHKGFENINIDDELSKLSLVNYSDQSTFFAVGGKLENSYNNVLNYMSEQGVMVGDMGKNEIINERVLSLFPKK